MRAAITPAFFIGGRKRGRTSDLSLVRAALSQLSYPPAWNTTGFRGGRQHAQYVSGRAVLCRALGHLAVLALRYPSGVSVLGIRYFSSPSYTHSRHWRLERREIRLQRRPGLS